MIKDKGSNCECVKRNILNWDCFTNDDLPCREYFDAISLQLISVHQLRCDLKRSRTRRVDTRWWMLFWTFTYLVQRCVRTSPWEVSDTILYTLSAVTMFYGRWLKGVVLSVPTLLLDWYCYSVIIIIFMWFT